MSCICASAAAYRKWINEIRSSLKEDDESYQWDHPPTGFKPIPVRPKRALDLITASDARARKRLFLTLNDWFYFHDLLLVCGHFPPKTNCILNSELKDVWDEEAGFVTIIMSFMFQFAFFVFNVQVFMIVHSLQVCSLSCSLATISRLKILIDYCLIYEIIKYSAEVMHRGNWVFVFIQLTVLKYSRLSSSSASLSAALQYKYFSRFHVTPWSVHNKLDTSSCRLNLNQWQMTNCRPLLAKLCFTSHEISNCSAFKWTKINVVWLQGGHDKSVYCWTRPIHFTTACVVSCFLIRF